MPYTTLVTGTTITAAWANGSVRDQVVTPFANASARDSAITSPVDGMVCITTDFGYLYRYSLALTKWVRLESSSICTADTSWTTNVTLSTIPNGNTVPNGGLTFPVDINSWYRWRLECHLIGQTGVGLACSYAQPSNARGDWLATGLNSAGAAFNGGASNVTTASGAVGTFTSQGFTVVGSTHTGITSGSVTFSFAQGVSSGLTSWVLTSTQLSHEQVA